MALASEVRRRPVGYELAASDVEWEERYLSLEPPPAVHELPELGYRDYDDMALSEVAFTEPFRVLSAEGAEIAERISRDLEAVATGDARSKRLRGCTYRSRFFAGMYSDPRLVAFVSDLARANLRPHPIRHHQVQLNFAPEELSKDVDVWHHDVVAYDFVMLVTDPAGMKGGSTEYFDGTVEEGMGILEKEGALPAGRVHQVRYPAAGWAFLQQGHSVLHRAARLEEPYPRVSLVASYYCADGRFREPTILPPLRKADGLDVALVEWADYAAYRTIERFQKFLDDQPDFSLPLDELKRRFADCLVDAERAIKEFDSDDPGFIIGID